ncbi:MAG: hypothetical protein AAF488_00485 [Planctomycetota bacterium]
MTHGGSNIANGRSIPLLSNAPRQLSVSADEGELVEEKTLGTRVPMPINTMIRRAEPAAFATRAEFHLWS